MNSAEFVKLFKVQSRTREMPKAVHPNLKEDCRCRASLQRLYRRRFLIRRLLMLNRHSPNLLQRFWLKSESEKITCTAGKTSPCANLDIDLPTSFLA